MRKALRRPSSTKVGSLCCSLILTHSAPISVADSWSLHRLLQQLQQQRRLPSQSYYSTSTELRMMS